MRRDENAHWMKGIFEELSATSSGSNSIRSSLGHISHVCCARHNFGCVRTNSLLCLARETTTFGCLRNTFFRWFRLFSAVKDDYYSSWFVFLLLCFAFGRFVSVCALRRTLQHLYCLLFLMLSYKKCIKINYYFFCFRQSCNRPSAALHSNGFRVHACMCMCSWSDNVSIIVLV